MKGVLASLFLCSAVSLASSASQVQLQFHADLRAASAGKGFESLILSDSKVQPEVRRYGPAYLFRAGLPDQPVCVLSKWKNAKIKASSEKDPLILKQGFAFVISGPALIQGQLIKTKQEPVPSFYRSTGRHFESVDGLHKTHAWDYFTIGLDEKSYPFQNLTCRSKVSTMNGMVFESDELRTSREEENKKSPYAPTETERSWVSAGASPWISLSTSN